MRKYNELVEAGAPELPEGYYYFIHPVKHQEPGQFFIDVKIANDKTGESIVHRYRFNSEPSLNANSSALEHLVAACQQTYEKWLARRVLTNNSKIYDYFTNNKLTSAPLDLVP